MKMCTQKYWNIGNVNKMFKPLELANFEVSRKVRYQVWQFFERAFDLLHGADILMGWQVSAGNRSSALPRAV